MLLVCFGEASNLVFLFAEGTQNANAQKVFANDPRDAIQIFLHPFVKGRGFEHNRKNDNRQKGNDNGKHPSTAHVNGKCHSGGSQHDDRRAQKQTKCEVDGRLYLIDVARQACDECGGSYTVGLCIGEFLNVCKQVASQVGAHANSGTGSKILGDKRAGQSNGGKSNQNAKARTDNASVTCGYAFVDNGLDYKRHQKVKNCFEQLEQRADNALFCVRLKIFQQLLHAHTSFLFIYLIS